MCRKLLLSITMPNDVFFFHFSNPKGHVKNTFCPKVRETSRNVFSGGSVRLDVNVATFSANNGRGKYRKNTSAPSSVSILVCRCGVWREIDNSINLCHLTSGSHASRSRFQPKTNLNSHSSCNKTFDCFISLRCYFSVGKAIFID